MRLRLAAVAPVVARLVERDRQRARHLDEHRPVGAAIFEDQHAVPPVLAQPVGKHAAGRARADDDEVEDLGHRRVARKIVARSGRASGRSNGVGDSPAVLETAAQSPPLKGRAIAYGIIRPLPPCGGGLSALASQGAKRPRRLRRKEEGYSAGHCPIPVASAPATQDSRWWTPLPLSLGSASPRQEKEPSHKGGGGE